MDIETQGNPDEDADVQLIREILEPFAQALVFVAEKVQEHDERLGTLDKAVFDDIIGGIIGLKKKGERMTGIGGMREKYGKDFESYLPAFKKTFGKDDPFEDLYDDLEGQEKGEGFDEGGFVGERMAKLKEHLDGIREAFGPGANVKTEIEAEMPKEEGMVDLDVEGIKKLAERRKRNQ